LRNLYVNSLALEQAVTRQPNVCRFLAVHCAGDALSHFKFRPAFKRDVKLF